jgi:hypothetical protein
MTKRKTEVNSEEIITEHERDRLNLVCGALDDLPEDLMRLAETASPYLRGKLEATAAILAFAHVQIDSLTRMHPYEHVDEQFKTYAQWQQGKEVTK